MKGVRFAPSPTGRFHLGNLRTAWVSWRISKLLGEPWIVRFEDIDTPRVIAGAQDQQLADLKMIGLVADQVDVQSNFRNRHWQLFLQGIQEGHFYPCTCSRKEVQEALVDLSSAPHHKTAEYNGHCRNLRSFDGPVRPQIGWRFRGEFEDGSQDFLVARTSWVRSNQEIPGEGSFSPSYHFACAVDDWDGGFRQIVRAWDLESALAHQRTIQHWLNKSTSGTQQLPSVFHTSLVVQNSGHRLEKRTQGVTLPEVLAGGRSVKQVLNQFSVSFRDAEKFALALSPEQCGGELQRQISLSELGF